MVEIKDWQFSVPTEVGVLTVEGNEFFVTSAGFGSGIGDRSSTIESAANHSSSKKSTHCALKHKAEQQITSYLAGQCMQFDLPVMTQGSRFQQIVWTALEGIPSGQTRTYGEIAKLLGSSARAVGGACRRNPVALIVPCHRVVAANGPGGYGGKTAGHNMRIKSWLLKHEA